MKHPLNAHRSDYSMNISPKLDVTSDAKPEPIACVPRQVEAIVVRNHFTIAERLAALDQPWDPSERLSLRFIATPPM